MKQELLKNRSKRENKSFGGVINLVTSNYLGVRMSFLIMFLILPIMAQCQGRIETRPAQSKTLVWSDEFNYNGLPDSTKWNFQVGKSRSNNEPQWYTKDPKNIQVANENLTITCRIENIESEQRYTSARINTRGKYTTTLGRIEARAKVPAGRGSWPAFWTLGLAGGWPTCGEIDIMEYWGTIQTPLLQMFIPVITIIPREPAVVVKSLSISPIMIFIFMQSNGMPTGWISFLMVRCFIPVSQKVRGLANGPSMHLNI